MTVDSLHLSESAIESTDMIIKEGTKGRDLRWLKINGVRLDGNVSRGKIL